MRWLTDRRALGFNWLEFFLLLAVVTMPYNNNLNSYCIVAFCFVGLLSNSPREKWLRMQQHKTWILPVAYFAFMALRLAWDPGPGRSTGILEKSTSFIALPLIVASIPPLNRDSIRRILFLFVLAVVAAALYCLWQSYLEYQATHYINVFFYHHLSMHLRLNAIYFSLYAVFSVWILLYYCFFNEAGIPVRIVSFVLTAFLIFLTILLASKMLLFILFFSLLVVTVYSFFYLPALRPRLIVLMVFLVAIPLTLFQFPYIKSRINDTKLLEYRSAADKFNGVAVRSSLWKATWTLIKEKPLLGHGHYAAQHELEKEYAKEGLVEAVRDGYNSHNQYLFTWSNYGIIGLLLLASYMILFVVISIRQRHLLAIVFGSVFLIANLTECMLQVQKGIVFYILFSSVFLYHLFEEKSSTNKNKELPA